MPGTETERHRNLKRLALAWAQQQGYAICSVEVRLPRSGYRADVAGYRPASRKQPLPPEGRLVRQPIIGTTAVWECKQARSDFLKDSRSAAETTQRLEALEARRQTLERLLGGHLPSLRKGESLFAEYDAIDASRYEHRGYRNVLREINLLQARLHGQTKFDKLGRWRCANLCYLVVEAGVLLPHEVPRPWGLLVRHDDSLALERLPLWQEVVEPSRLELLQRLALAGTRRLNRELGVPVVAPAPQRG